MKHDEITMHFAAEGDHLGSSFTTECQHFGTKRVGNLIHLIAYAIEVGTICKPRKNDGQRWYSDAEVELNVIHLAFSDRQSRLLPIVQHFAGELFGGQVHLLFGLVVEGDGAVFVEGEGLGLGFGGFEVMLGEL